jgi:hypothetical protein
MTYHSRSRLKNQMTCHPLGGKFGLFIYFIHFQFSPYILETFQLSPNLWESIQFHHYPYSIRPLDFNIFFTNWSLVSDFFNVVLN